MAFFLFYLVLVTMGVSAMALAELEFTMSSYCGGGSKCCSVSLLLTLISPVASS